MSVKDCGTWWRVSDSSKFRIYDKRCSIRAVFPQRSISTKRCLSAPAIWWSLDTPMPAFEAGAWRCLRFSIAIRSRSSTDSIWSLRMRSRLPGKLRSDSLLLGGVIVKNRTRFAKRRLVMRAVIDQILHQTDQSPREQEAEAQQQQQSDRDIHGVHRNKSQGTIL